MRDWLKTYVPYFPLFGMGLYLVVFTIAAMDYPGGSYNVPNEEGYSFFHNFLCDVMNPVTQSGAHNDARPLAIVSHLLLSFTMISFFYVLPEIFKKDNRNTRMMRWVGILTMTVFIFMYTPYHDEIVTATGILGTIALVPFFMELIKYDNKRLRQLAYMCYLLSIVVFFIFETRIGYYYLPFLQKITFVVDAWWVIWVCLIVLKKNREESQVTFAWNDQ